MRRGIEAGTVRTARALLIATFVCALAVIPAVTGVAAEGEVTVSIVSMDDEAFPRMQMVMTADIDGRPLAELDASSLRVLEGPRGEAREARVLSVTSAVDAETPLALVLVIDASGSMEGAPIAEARAAAASMIESLQRGDAAAVLAFADGVEVLQAVTDDHAALLDAVSRLEALGNTTLYDAVAEAATQAGSTGYQRRAVVLLSDGVDFGGLSSRTPDESLDAVSAADTVFYVVGFGADIDRPFLEAVAERSGGRFFVASATEDIATVYASLEELLRSQLVVTFESAAPEVGLEREIEVRLAVDGGSGAATRAYESSRPQPTPVAATPAAAATAVATPAAAPADLAANGGTPWLPLALVVVVGVGAAGAVAVRRRALPRNAFTVDVATLDVRPLPVDVGPALEPSWAVLEVLMGHGPATLLPLGAAPVTVGSGPGCTLRLPAAPGVALEHARIWNRDGRPMLHHLAGGHVTLVNGADAEWASLRESDEVQIGPYIIRCRAAAPDAAPIASTGGTR